MVADTILMPSNTTIRFTAAMSPSSELVRLRHPPARPPA
jgi:hypothetical protein